MRFLYLHGMGTNSRIFEAQTAAIRYAMGPQHTFEFLDGAVPTQIAPGIASFLSFFLSHRAYLGSVEQLVLTYSAGIELFVSSSDEYLQYADYMSSESCRKALSDLEMYIAEDGPFDGVMAFSQGAVVAVSMLLQRAEQDPLKARLYPVFRCAIFFGGGVPVDLRWLRGERPRRLMRWEEDGEIIEIPTVHIWGKNDRLYPDFGPILSKLCRARVKEEFVHEGGHDIPGARDPAVVERVAMLINRTIERAETVQ